MTYSDDTLLMNTHTGSVDTYENWLCDYEAYKSEDGQDTWEEWGVSLAEVEEVEDEDGEITYAQI